MYTLIDINQHIKHTHSEYFGRENNTNLYTMECAASFVAFGKLLHVLQTSAKGNYLFDLGWALPVSGILSLGA